MDAAAGERDFDVSRSTIARIVNLVNIYLIRYPFERYSVPLSKLARMQPLAMGGHSVRASFTRGEVTGCGNVQA
jgi:hypothetical protein